MSDSGTMQLFNRQTLLAKFTRVILKHDRLDSSPEQLIRVGTDTDCEVDFRPIVHGDGINAAHTRELANSFLVDAFYSHEVFKKLPIELVEELLQHMKPVTLKNGEVLFQAGDQGTNMFVVHTGSIACINTQGKEVKVLAQGTPQLLFT